MRKIHTLKWQEFFSFIYLGGPDNCGERLSPITLVEEGQASVFVAFLCGNPKPTVHWTIGRRQISSSVDNTPSTGMYKYSTNIKISLEACGETVRYVAAGHGRELTSSTVIKVSCKVCFYFKIYQFPEYPLFWRNHFIKNWLVGCQKIKKHLRVVKIKFYIRNFFQTCLPSINDSRMVFKYYYLV